MSSVIQHCQKLLLLLYSKYSPNTLQLHRLPFSLGSRFRPTNAIILLLHKFLSKTFCYFPNHSEHYPCSVQYTEARFINILLHSIFIFLITVIQIFYTFQSLYCTRFVVLSGQLPPPF